MRTRSAERLTGGGVMVRVAPRTQRKEINMVSGLRKWAWGFNYPGRHEPLPHMCHYLRFCKRSVYVVSVWPRAASGRRSGSVADVVGQLTGAAVAPWEQPDRVGRPSVDPTGPTAEQVPGERLYDALICGRAAEGAATAWLDPRRAAS